MRNNHIFQSLTIKEKLIDILRVIVNMRVLVGCMVFNATFNNISVISWQSVLLVEESGVPRENH